MLITHQKTKLLNGLKIERQLFKIRIAAYFRFLPRRTYSVPGIATYFFFIILVGCSIYKPLCLIQKEAAATVLFFKVIKNMYARQQNCTTPLCTLRVCLYLYFEMTLKNIYNLYNNNDSKNNKVST